MTNDELGMAKGKGQRRGSTAEGRGREGPGVEHRSEGAGGAEADDGGAEEGGCQRRRPCGRRGRRGRLERRRQKPIASRGQEGLDWRLLMLAAIPGLALFR